jgi:cell division protein ZipA
VGDLRLILLLAGVALIAAVWWFGRRRGTAVGEGPAPRARAKDPEERTVRAEPTLEIRTRPEPRAGGFDPERQKIVALHITPAGDSRFLGADVLEALDDAGLKYGRRQVFHRLDMNETSKSVYQVANLVEPGSFDLGTIAQTWIPGLTFFMVLPGPKDGVAAFADMLATARRIARHLRGEVKDATRSTLTRQTAHHIREEIVAFQHRRAQDGDGAS